MAASHPLDRPAWSALTGRHASFAVIRGGARRYHPAFGVFAGVGDQSEVGMEDIAALVAEHGDLAFLEGETPPLPPGLRIFSQAVGVQMVATRIIPRPMPDAAIVPLSQDDAPAMLALATLTEPGPFFAQTNQLGDFFGIRVGGALVAMAGERMKPDGHTEVSGVCTHPDHRGRGYAGALMGVVAARILERGEIPFLHAYASNTAAIALYGCLGFALRRHVLMTRLTGLSAS